MYSLPCLRLRSAAARFAGGPGCLAITAPAPLNLLLLPWLQVDHLVGLSLIHI